MILDYEVQLIVNNIESKKVLKILNLNMVNNHNINKTILKKK